MIYNIRPVSTKEFGSAIFSEAAERGLKVTEEYPRIHSVYRQRTLIGFWWPPKKILSISGYLGHDDASVEHFFIDPKLDESQKEDASLRKEYVSALLERLNSQKPSH